MEVLDAAVRLAAFELVLTFLKQARRRLSLSLSALRQRFRLSPRCKSLPDPVLGQHPVASSDQLVPAASLSGSGSSQAARRS